MTNPLQKKRCLKVHAGIRDTLKYGKTYMGIAGALWTFGQSQMGTEQHVLYALSTLFLIAGFLISSPNAAETPADHCDHDV